ncbi:MAG: hypothetical protein ACT4PI_12835, partial [Actinomycetota bacterium]
MSDETVPEATNASEETNTTNSDPAERAGGGATDTPSGSGDGVGPKRRRRRGSRGGRNRKKPADRARPDVDDDAELGGGGEDHTDPAADRGLTSDDVAADAKEDAGLTDGDGAPGAPGRPKIGDRRPAPKPAREEPAEVRSGSGR